ncbi:MAG: sodium:proton antiporter NhaD [Lewinellaceae bacterium]|nr:sodium:proton antiporter NhaD [Saprospiraceae bacterium]MCB9345785.1 sodium:proton antiporter NhaD [Lewinellaceae bacterium]
MAIFIIVVFIIGYVLIALEHPIKIDKAASALLTGVICWLVLLFGLESMPAFAHIAGEFSDKHDFIDAELGKHLGEISEILFFLLGAMTIVELVDVHDGFRIITDRIATSSRVRLLWIIAWITFFLSAALDNMTTAIIMSALIRKIIKKQDNVWLFGGFVIIAANAGGAWSPIGDITTIMLWIGGQVTSLNIIHSTFLASCASLLAPLFVVSYTLRKDKTKRSLHAEDEMKSHKIFTPFEQKAMFFLGAAGLLAVPIFKTSTHLPPYMGVLLSVGVLWYITEIMHKGKKEEVRHEFSVAAMLHRIDTPSILFFLGILLAVGALDVSGHLQLLAHFLDNNFGNIYVINGLIGILSAIVDNVPLVAACMGMYDLTQVPPDNDFWELLAYCAGTGGSMLIIGSAAGVASMGILKIDFIWYMKRISVYAFIGYLAGMLVYYLQHHFHL